jgi:hypothetical protein
MVRVTFRRLRSESRVVRGSAGPARCGTSSGGTVGSRSSRTGVGFASDSGRRSQWHQLDRPVEQDAAGGGRAIRPQRPADLLGGVLGDDRPDDRRRRRGPPADEVPEHLAREDVLGDEAPQTGRLDMTDISPHGTTSTTPDATRRIASKGRAEGSSAGRWMWVPCPQFVLASMPNKGH